MASSTKAWILLGVFSGIALLGGHYIAGREGLLWALALSLSINSYIYFTMDRRIWLAYLGREVEGQDPWGLLNAVEKGRQHIRLPRPRIWILEESAPQALVWGRSWKHGNLAVTQGLLDAFSKKEIEAVVAYQLACLHRLDTLAFDVSSALLGTLCQATEAIDFVIRVVIGAKKQDTSARLATLSLAPLIGLWLRLAIGRSTYLEADKLAAKILEDPHQLATVIWKLDSFSQTQPFLTSPAHGHHFIVNPLTGFPWARYFRVQPAAEKRIKNLIGYFPI